jgi:hypothetical protein
MAPPVMPLLVTANQAGGERVAHVGYPIPITAHALGGTAIRAIEMWLGGERIGAPTQTFGRRLFVGLHAAGRPTPASRT